MTWFLGTAFNSDSMNEKKQRLEVWMRGPITGVPPILQPVAHTLLQVQEDISRLVDNDLSAQIWIQPKGMASIGFHLQHIHGVIDRMWSYAMDQPLSEEQFEALRKEGVPDETQTVEDLKSAVSRRIYRIVEDLESIPENTLPDTRYLGRKRIPTTLIGLLFHAAEHAQRHYGQLLVTVNFLRPVPKDNEEHD